MQTIKSAKRKVLNNSKRIIGAVLAGGQSARMGSDKGLLEVDAHNMIAQTVNIIESTSVNHVVVSRNDRKAEHIQDLIPNKGPLGGIYSLMSAFPDCDLLIIPVDLPLLTADVLQTLVNVGQSSSSNTHFGGHVLPLYISTQPAMLTYLKNVLTDMGNLSIRRFVASFPINEIALDENKALFNANTPAQWEQAMRLKGK